MTSSAPLTDARVETYLSRLAAALAGVAGEEKDEIVREIRAHILDSLSSATDPGGALDRVLRLLGTPEALANRYATESLLTHAGRSFSPWLLLLTSWRWAQQGIMGTITLLVALFGYGTTTTLTVAIFLKPFVPRVGMWLGPRSLNVGVPSNPGEMRELLGQWFVPVIAVCAFAIGVGTTHALRWIIRKRPQGPIPG